MTTNSLRATTALLLIPLALVACGGSSSTSAPSATTAPATPTPTPTATPSPTVAPTPQPGVALIGTRSAEVAGTSKTVLTDSHGLTLYFKTTDSAMHITCTGDCAANWPPVLLASGVPTGSPSVTGRLTVFAGPNGNQVLYDGHPLYRWVGDTSPGQATGQGLGGFLVASPTL